MRKRTRVPKQTLGQRLRTLRQARGLTQVQLAKASGITQRAISYYETDTGLPPATAAAALARALNVSTDELLGLKVPKVDHLGDDAETRRLWKRFRQVASLPERDQRAVIRLINSLSGRFDSFLRLPLRFDFCFREELFTESLVLLYAGIDALAWLALPSGDVNGSDFVKWVNTYLLPDSGLQCTAEDIWAARCGLLHSEHRRVS